MDWAQGEEEREKAPCRYLHYEVDWDERDINVNGTKGKEKEKGKPYRIGIGLGPGGKDVQVASDFMARTLWDVLKFCNSYPRNGSIVTFADSIILCWASFML